MTLFLTCLGLAFAAGVLSFGMAIFILALCRAASDDGDIYSAPEGELSHVFATAIDDDLNRGGF